ncbi:MAG TPA: carboxypeptidase-like regulatory domain-containing protein, partial [Chryseosolibacter sp.]
EETITTTNSNEDGEFLIRGLEAGTYELVFDGPGDAPVVEKTGVVVDLGIITDLTLVSVPQ